MNQVLHPASLLKKIAGRGAGNVYASPEMLFDGIVTLQVIIGLGKIMPAEGTDDFFTFMQRMAAGAAQLRIEK